MTQEPVQIPLEQLAHGDQVEIAFDPPLSVAGVDVSAARGEIYTVIGQVYIALQDHRSDFGLPVMERIDTHDGLQIRRLESSVERKARLLAKRRGEVIFGTAPRCTAELLDQIDALSQMVHAAPSEGRWSRRDELKLQFNELCDRVQLAKRKRYYMLERARLGRDFHPWTDPEPSIFRIETVRPLPSDFEIDRQRRIDREQRFTEAIAIFGEAERETRQYASALRALGLDVRRPHPNAQELLVRISWANRDRFDLRFRPSPNGLWQLESAQPSNKGQARLRARLIREGHIERVQAMIDSAMIGSATL